MIIKTKKHRAEALAQILILIISIVAFSYLVGGIGVVSAVDISCPTTCTGDSDCGGCCEGNQLVTGGKCVTNSDDEKVCDYSSSYKNLVPEKCGYNPESSGSGDKDSSTWDKVEGVLIAGGSAVQVWDKLENGLTGLANKGAETEVPALVIPSSSTAGDAILTEALAEADAWLFAQGEALAAEDLAAAELGLAELEGGGITFAEWIGGEGGILSKGVNWVWDGFSGVWTGEETGFIQETAVWAAAIYIVIKALDWVIKDEEWSAFLSKAARDAALAFVATEAAVELLATLGVELVAELELPVVGWIAAAVTILYELFTWRTEQKQVITFQCQPWQAPEGGADCEKCNNQGLIPCSEYQCKSLGQACELINKGTTNQKCISGKDDGKYPTIQPWTNALLNGDYYYTPVSVMSPPDKGVYIKYKESNDGCIPAFTRLSFGVLLDENAQCKISTTREASYDAMGNKYMGGPIFNESHFFQLTLPSASSLQSENISLANDGEYELFVRCEDYHGHSNPANFVFKFCIDEGPDYTSPKVELANPLNGMPIAHNEDEIEATFYINEPAECRWSHLNKDYESMENSMSCDTKMSEMNAYMLYRCTTTLTDLENDKENKFYVRCKDQPFLAEGEGQRNTNLESYEYTLVGTQPLVLDWVTPNDTLVKGPTENVEVKIEAETSAGYDDGMAVCYYSLTGNQGSYIEFYETNSYEHSQSVWLDEGEHEMYIQCIDLGGNTDEAVIEFEVETDTDWPEITRMYYEDDYLKLITDEAAICVYSKTDCRYIFDDGIPMENIDNIEHYIDWNSNVNFYIKCKENRDAGLYPPSGECSIIARPFDIYSE